jgi:hypothetical protein
MEQLLGLVIALVIAGIILYLGVYGATAFLAVFDEITHLLKKVRK